MRDQGYYSIPLARSISRRTYSHMYSENNGKIEMIPYTLLVHSNYAPGELDL